MSATNMILLPIVFLLVGVLLELILARQLSPRGKGWLALVSSLAAFGAVLAAWPTILSGASLGARVGAWDGPVALAYHVDGLSLLFALMATGIGAVVLVYSIAYMERDAGATRFYAFMLVFIAGLVHLVYSADLVLLYLSWEVIGLCSFFLVGFWYRRREAAAGARKVLVMTHLAGYGLLAAILILAARTGSTLWTDPQVAGAFTTGLFLLMLVSAVAKSVQFPLHTWIPDAMAAPTPVSALLHAACYVKAGVYLIARMHSLAPWAVEWQTLVVWIGTITMVVGVLYALVQSDLKRLLAFHTVSQIGYMVMGLGLGTPLGIAAGLLHCLNHAFFKGGLFLCAGSVERMTGTRDMDRLGGLARRMPTTATFWLILAGSIAGVPLLSGFVSKWLLYNAALEAGQVVPALVAWIVSVLTVFSFLKATSSVFLGEPSPELADAAGRGEAPRVMLIAAGSLAAGSLLLGLAPQLAVQYLVNPILPAVGSAPLTGISWLGLSVAGGSWFATGGLILAVCAVGIGGVVFWLAQPARRVATVAVGAAGGVFTGGEPLAGPAHLPASDFSIIVKQGLAPFYHWAEVDRYYLAAWRTLLGVSGALGQVSMWLEERAIWCTLIFAALLAGLAGATSGAVAGGPEIAAGGLVSQSPILVGSAVAFVALLLALSATPARRSAWFLAISGLLALGGLAVQDSPAGWILLEAAAVVALALVWSATSDPAARRIYALAVVLSALAVAGGMLAASANAPGAARLLLLVGFAVKLALVPVYLWLPKTAERVPAAVVGFVVAVVDVAAFGELLTLRQSAPWLFAPVVLWLGLALATALGGAVLTLAQHDLKRLLAFSTVEDMGVLLVGVTLGSSLGVSGVVAGLTVHALAKALLFASVGAAEADGPVTLDSRGLASARPIAGAGFVVGALAILGVPPTAGFGAHWRLYSAAVDMSPWLLFGLLLAAALALLAYARVIAWCWWGAGETEGRRESAAIAAAVIGLSVILIALGLWPGVITGG